MPELGSTGVYPCEHCRGILYRGFAIKWIEHKSYHAHCGFKIEDAAEEAAKEQEEIKT